MRNRNLLRTSKIAAVLTAALASGADAADVPTLTGCYERVYDAAHLAQHRNQFVIRATLLIALDTSGQKTGEANPVVASGVLKIWVRGRSQSFNSIGACWAEGEALLCNGSLSAAEATPCKSVTDGIHQCRIGRGDSGSFKIEGKADGVLVSVRERLELVPAPYDTGPYLYFSPTNPENHAFLLTRKPPEACK